MMALVSLVIPIYNEQDGIPHLFLKLNSVLQDISDFDFEFVCVDDGSRDDSLKVLSEQMRLDSRVRIVELSRNFGKEAAMTAGLDVARGDAVIPIDADLQDPPELISVTLS